MLLDRIKPWLNKYNHQQQLMLVLSLLKRSATRGCKRGEDYLLLPCKICKRWVHKECCKTTIIEKYQLKDPVDVYGNKVVVCTKGCFDKLDKLRSSSSVIAFDSDGKMG